MARALTARVEGGVSCARLYCGLFLSVAVLLPKTGNAQVYQFRTPAPVVTAVASRLADRGDPVVVNGLVYYPTRGFRFFDGQVMMQVGVFERVPLYADTTLEPFSIVYVPIGRDRMRAYERRRDGELAGTTGSRPPSFPVQSPSVQALRDTSVGAVGTSGLIEPAQPPLAAVAPAVPSSAVPATVGTSGGDASNATSSVGTAGARTVASRGGR